MAGKTIETLVLFANESKIFNDYTLNNHIPLTILNTVFTLSLGRFRDEVQIKRVEYFPYSRFLDEYIEGKITWDEILGFYCVSTTFGEYCVDEGVAISIGAEDIYYIDENKRSALMRGITIQGHSPLSRLNTLCSQISLDLLKRFHVLLSRVVLTEKRVKKRKISEISSSIVLTLDDWKNKILKLLTTLETQTNG